MSTIAIALVLVSAFLHALKAFFIKTSHHKVAFAWLYVFTGFVLFTPIGVWSYLKNSPSISGIIPLILITSFVHGAYTFVRSVLYEKADLSFAYPITQSAPLITTLWYLITKTETLNIYGISGIILITLGTYIIKSSEKSKKGFFAIFRKENRNILLAFTTTILVAAYSITDDVIVETIDPLLLSYYLCIPILIVLTPYLIAKKELNFLKKEWKINKKSIIFTGLISPIGYLLVLFAFNLAEVSYITALRQSSVLLGVLMGYKILKEGYMLKRISGSILIIIGAIVISVFG